MSTWKDREQQRVRASIESDAEAYSQDGVRRWRSNDAVIPPCVYRDAGMECTPAHQAAYDREIAAFLDEYRRNQPPVPSDEEAFEMRAAFGPGVEVVDIITGRRHRT